MSNVTQNFSEPINIHLLKLVCTNNNYKMYFLITGGAKRVGAYCVRYLHAQGCNILLHYRSSTKEAKALADELMALDSNELTKLKIFINDYP